VNNKKTLLVNLNSITSQQKSEIAKLKVSLAKVESEKAALALKVDNILVFGKPYSKSGFITFATSVVIALAILIVVLLLMYRMTFRSAREIKTLNEELHKEFDDYKHMAVEKEIKLSRELQNYRNRMSELKSA
jgi:short subunit fatty acids transporter